MNLVLNNIFEVAVVRRPQDGVGYVFSDDLGDSFCNPFIGTDFCEAEDVISVGFVLGVAVGCDLCFCDAGVSTDSIGRLSSCCNHVSIIDVDG